MAEAAPRYDGHKMARKLADAGVQTTLIADSAVFAMMARVNKVGAVLPGLRLMHVNMCLSSQLIQKQQARA